MKTKTKIKGASEEFVASKTVGESPTAPTETHAVETLEHDEIALSAPAAATSSFDTDDLTIPPVQIAYAVGGLGENFTPGSFVYDGMTALTDGVKPLEVTLVSIKKFFMENIPFGDDRIPDMLATKQEVHALGKTTTWSNEDGEKRPPDYLPVIDCHLLVPKPEALDDPEADGLFMLEGPDGRDYGLGKIRLKKTSHSAAGRTIVSAIQFGQWKTPSDASFLLTAPQRTFGKNRTYVATAKRGPKHEPEFVDWASKLATELI